MLKVENLSRQTQLVERGRVADNAWTRFWGLMGVREFKTGDGLLIKPCKGVHCMFMAFPIDVLYLNRQAQVIAMDLTMRPWSIGRIYRQCQHVLELPIGSIQRTHTAIGDQLYVQV